MKELATVTSFDVELYAEEFEDYSPDVDDGLLAILDVGNPLADPYLANLAQIKHRIVAQHKEMSRRHGAVVRLLAQGRRVKEIAALTNYSSGRVSEIAKTRPAKMLLSLYRAYQAGIDGPQIAQKAAMLWRIACNNEIEAPHVAIQALKELNAMAGINSDAKSGTNKGITININAETLPRTILDGN